MKPLLSESEPTPYVPSQKTLRGSTIKHKPEWDNKKSKPLHQLTNETPEKNTTSPRKMSPRKMTSPKKIINKLPESHPVNINIPN